ncbi:MAG: hypothetical protein HRU26_05155 [Psychroserpens sp.]|nr:hypothetical protein [Psychroserpens sp.]
MVSIKSDSRFLEYLVDKLYDEEGKLIRVKRETERGIVTVQESRSNVFNQDN